jgi:hypothetical protein
MKALGMTTFTTEAEFENAVIKELSSRGWEPDL